MFLNFFSLLPVEVFGSSIYQTRPSWNLFTVQPTKLDLPRPKNIPSDPKESREDTITIRETQLIQHITQKNKKINPTQHNMNGFHGIVGKVGLQFYFKLG